MTSKNAEAATATAMTLTLTLTPRVCRSKNVQDTSKYPENFNPNVLSQQPQPPQRSPVSKPFLFSNPNTSSSSSPAAVSKSCSAKKSHKPIKNPNNTPLVVNKIRQRKFVVAKKKQKEGDAAADAGSTASFCKCKDKSSKCLCLAYHNLRKSQEEFFNNRPHHDHEEEEATETENENQSSVLEQGQGGGKLGNNGVSLLLKRSREISVPQSVSGSGKVMNLVKAFEKLLSVAPDNDHDQKEEEEKETREKNDKVVMKWPPPKLQQQLHTAPETGLSGSSSFCPPNFTLTSQNLGLDHPRASVSSSWDNNSSVSSRTSNGGRRSRRNSLESSSTLGGRRWRKKQQKVTNQKPFKLRTEQRGKLKEEEFVKKVQEMMTEEEKQRIPIAQGLPWTTDEPECLVKPPVKETTIPIDLKLHSDVRAMDRAEFDQQVAEKLSFIEQYKLERERQQKLAEEEEVRRLRKELVPKAQPMPYFDRPFLPRRSMKNPTIPREPKFHKKIKCSLSSWNDMNPYSSGLH